MQISVITLRGTTIDLDVEPTDTIASVKAKIRDNGFDMPIKFELAFGYEQLDCERTLI